jgi:hypothetical protein
MEKTAIATLALVAMLAAGCGGTQGAGLGASDLIPVSAAAFIQVDTDPGSAQWKAVNALADRFPDKQKAVDAIDKKLRKTGLDWQKDVKPALGKELDVVWLDFAGGGKDFVALLQPQDEGKFKTLVRKANETGGGSNIVYDRFKGWEVLSESRAAITSFEQASNAEQSSLSDNAWFQRAMGELGNGVARVYVSGPAVMNRLSSSLGSSMRESVQKIGTLDWLGMNLGATSAGIRWNVIVHGTAGKYLGGVQLKNYASHLASTVPQDSLLYVTFHGSGSGFGGLTSSSPLFAAPQLRPLKSVLREVGKLVAGEDAVYVRPAPNGGIPEVAIVTEPAPGTNGAAAIDRLLRRFRGDLHATPRLRSIAGTQARVIDFGSFAIDYANVGNKLVVTNYPDGIWGVKLNGKLSQSPTYQDALSSAGMPAKTPGFVYVNVHSTIPLIEHLAHLHLPGEIQRNLAPLRSALEYEVARSHEVEVSFFLRIK